MHIVFRPLYRVLSLPDKHNETASWKFLKDVRTHTERNHEYDIINTSASNLSQFYSEETMCNLINKSDTKLKYFACFYLRDLSISNKLDNGMVGTHCFFVH